MLMNNKEEKLKQDREIAHMSYTDISGGGECAWGGEKLKIGADKVYKLSDSQKKKKKLS